MYEATLDISSHSVVMTGSFNPAIFHPQWFAREGLLPQGEADDAKLQVVHPQLSQFETERFLFQVTLDRLMIMTKPDSPAEPLRDLVLGCFYILEHTPVTAMGINHSLHFALGSEVAWHNLGDALAPKEPWNAIMDGRPGLRKLEILASKPSDQGPSVTVKVEPSILVQWGVYFEINEHYPAEGQFGLQGLMEILKDRWEGSQKDGERNARHILDWAAAQS